MTVLSLPCKAKLRLNHICCCLSLQDFRKIHSLLTNIRPSSDSQDEIKAARNVQRGLASKVQDLSSVFRRKQRVYMDSEWSWHDTVEISFHDRSWTGTEPLSCLRSYTALQGHANKNKDLLTASGAITLKGPELYDELQADIEAVGSHIKSYFLDSSANVGCTASLLHSQTLSSPRCKLNPTERIFPRKYRNETANSRRSPSRFQTWRICSKTCRISS